MAGGHYCNAASFLAKRQDIPSLKMAAEIYKEEGESEKVSFYRNWQKKAPFIYKVRAFVAFLA